MTARGNGAPAQPWIRVLMLLCLPLGGCGSSSNTSDSAHSRLLSPGISGTIPFDMHLLVDQFGYRPGDAKIAVVRNPQVGYDRASGFSPGSSYQVRRSSDGGVVHESAPVAWNGGAIEPSSGDNGWWIDFSAIDTPGSYFVYDAQRKVRSATFNIGPDVYRGALRAAVRMYYYQRSGVAKRRPHADACWSDDAAYMGPGQDTEARDITDRGNRSKYRDLSGGWFDAGDTNKYVTFAVQPVHQLLTAYAESPAAFTDDFNIPESGNGIADVIDEVRWETDWLKKMQYPDGSAALKVGEIVYAPAAPPSSDHNVRYYVPSCSSSTIAVAGMFAHAAYVFAGMPALAGEAGELRARAIAAWNNYQGLPGRQAHCDTGIVHAGDADWSEEQQDAAAVVAAVYLFAITDKSGYDEYIRAHYRETKPYRDPGWSRYSPEQGEALLFYTMLANADPTTRRGILGDMHGVVVADTQIYGFNPRDDLYRAYMHDEQYHWGSNNPRAGYGNTNLDAAIYGIDPQGAGSYRLRALETLHYFHGVNPFAMVYLSNMYAYGATRSANQVFHAWFAHGTRWSDALSSACGPAPGYVPGGPNASAARSGVPVSLAPPTGQPPQKSYRDWNVGAPESSWAVTEPAIYYQSAYIKLLSKFVQ